MAHSIAIVPFVLFRDFYVDSRKYRNSFAFLETLDLEALNDSRNDWLMDVIAEKVYATLVEICFSAANSTSKFQKIYKMPQCS